MSFGIQVFDSFGNKTLDSGEAIGGVCLGYFVIPHLGTTLDFPLMVGRTGFGISVGINYGLVYTVTTFSGYLRFVFPNIGTGIDQTVLLFAK